MLFKDNHDSDVSMRQLAVLGRMLMPCACSSRDCSDDRLSCRPCGSSSSLAGRPTVPSAALPLLSEQPAGRTAVTSPVLACLSEHPAWLPVERLTDSMRAVMLLDRPGRAFVCCVVCSRPRHRNLGSQIVCSFCRYLPCTRDGDVTMLGILG